MAKETTPKTTLIGTLTDGGKVKVTASTEAIAIAALKGAGCVTYRVSTAVSLVAEAPKPPKAK